MQVIYGSERSHAQVSGVLYFVTSHLRKGASKMADRFPHLKGANAFPDIETVDVFEQYENDFDYSKYKANTKLKLLSVPWSSNTEAGGNVVKFETDTARDEWFDSVKGHTFEDASYMRILPGGTVRLPLPFDTVQRYNYLTLDIGAANLPHESQDRVRRYHYFVSSVRYIAPNTTECLLTPDLWTTYINSVQLSNIMLARGHAPMKETNVSDYLADPLNNNEWLLEPEPFALDGASKVTSSKFDRLNAETYAVIVTTADWNDATKWGTEASGIWSVPATQGYAQGVPAAKFFAIGTPYLDAFLAWLDEMRPQMVQTIRAICFISTSLITLGNRFSLGGFSLYSVTPRENVSMAQLELTKADFDYPSKYADIAKLYTSPYAVVRISNDMGDMYELRIEDMGARVALNYTVSLIEPMLTVDAHLNGYGSDALATVDFATLTKHTREYGGRWGEIAFKWAIPTYSVIQSARKHNEYADFYGRVQATNSYETAYANTLANAGVAKLNADGTNETNYNNALGSAATAKANSTNSYTTAKQNAFNAASTGYTNASNSANISKANADASADTVTANNALTVAANTSQTNKAIEVATEGVRLSNNKIASDTSYDIDLAYVAYNSTINETSVAYSNNDASAKASAASSIIGNLAALGNFQFGDFLLGNFRDSINTSTAWQSTMASIGVTLTNAVTLVNAQQRNANAKVLNATANASLMNDLSTDQLTFNTTTANTLANATTGNSVTTMKATAANTQNKDIVNAGNTKALAEQNAENDFGTAETNTSNTYNRTVANALASYMQQQTNIQRTYETAEANAQRSRTLSMKAIENGIQQAAMGAPLTFGTNTASDHGVQAPMMVNWQVITQPDARIAVAGDAFLRYGYTVNRFWPFETLNVMDRFTYWECADLTVTSEAGVIEDARAMIRAMLMTGITVWKRPEEIAKGTINGN